MRFHGVLLRLRALLFSGRLDDELDDEVRLHIEMQTRKLVAAGLTIDEAARQARLQFGAMERVKEECRDARRVRVVQALLQDTRYAIRGFRRSPGFSFIAVLGLVLGIGANSAMFSVVYAALLAPLPYPNPDQLVMVWSQINGRRNSVSTGDYLDWKRQNTAFQDVLAWSGGNFNVSTGGRPEVVRARIAAPGLLDMQGIPFLMGRDFRPEEGEEGRSHVAVITHRFWREHFGEDAGVLGREIRLNGAPYTIVGVLAAGMADRFESQLIVPLTFNPSQLGHDNRWLTVMARLKPGVTPMQANADMASVAHRIAEAHPVSNEGWTVSVEPLQNNFTSRNTIAALWLLMGAVGFVLLIACLNVSNQLLARSTARQREMALRASLGAGRRRLFAQLLTESLALALVGGVLGLAFGWVLLKVIVAILPPFSIPTEADVRLNLPVLGFSLAATAMAGVISGTLPAWQSSRSDLNGALKDGSRGMTASRGRGLRRLLVVGEVALALTLLGGAGLVLHSFWKMTRVDLGFRQDHILTFNLSIPDGTFSRPEEIVGFYRQLLDRIGALSGVSSAAASTGMPLLGPGFGRPFSIAGQSHGDTGRRPNVGITTVTPGYFQTFGVPILRGRGFTEHDLAGQTPVAIVNETFARKYLSGLDPLIERVVVAQMMPGSRTPGPPVEWHIVGIARDVRNGVARDEASAEIFLPLWQSPWPRAGIEVRTLGDPAAITSDVAAAVQSLNPDLGLDRVRTMEQVVDESLAGARFMTVLLALFAAMALLLACIGIYGVMSFAVAERTHEVGVRMALGARRSQVLQLVLREGVALALAGLAIGLGGAYFVGHALKAFLFGVTPTSPATMGAALALLFASALLACYVPARRAMRVDPMIALRAE
jgi:putative ABC transport system permease protein